MMQEKLEELYEGYRRVHPNEGFARCGLVDEAAYQNTSPKLVCVLREPNDHKHEVGSIPEFLRWLLGRLSKDPSDIGVLPHWEATWRPIGIWSYGIHNGFPRYHGINTVQNAAEGLKCIGMTNLKKSGGGPVADMKAVEEYATRTVSLWRTELEVMDPDIILCCGTIWIVTKLLKLGCTRTATGLYHAVWEHNGRETPLLSIYHPAERTYRQDMLYSFLKETLLELHY